MNKLLALPVLTYENYDVKCKRTSQVVDRTAFLLKVTTNDQQGPIESGLLELYVKSLIGSQRPPIMTDRSSSEEQIILVQWDIEFGKSLLSRTSRWSGIARVDSDRLRGAHQKKPQLLHRDVAMVHIYQSDALEIRYKDAEKTMALADLQRIFQSVWKDVFAFDFSNEKLAEMEFITPEGTYDTENTEISDDNHLSLRVHCFCHLSVWEKNEVYKNLRYFSFKAMDVLRRIRPTSIGDKLWTNYSRARRHSIRDAW